jgi:transcriptional regulator with XRE-family HTH domain
VILANRIRAIRKEKRLSRRDIAERTGLSRSYVSHVETGHTVPSIEILEKLAAALAVPLQQLFFEGEKPPPLLNLPGRLRADQIVAGGAPEQNSRDSAPLQDEKEHDRRRTVPGTQKLPKG